MRRLFGLFAVVGISGLPIICPPAVAALPPCPASLEVLDLQVPTYGRTAESLPAEILASNPERVAGAILSTGGVRSETTTPLDISRRQTRVVIPPGPAEPEFTVILTWNQDEGTPAECQGFISAVLPIIPSFASAGDPLVPRLVGKFRVYETAIRPPRKRILRPIWTFRPGCDYFACETKVKSSLRLRGEFELRPDGDYELFEISPPRYACVERSTKRVVLRRAYKEVIRVRISVTKEPGVNQVHSFTGKASRHFEATSRALAKGCKETAGYNLERYVGKRL